MNIKEINENLNYMSSVSSPVEIQRMLNRLGIKKIGYTDDIFQDAVYQSGNIYFMIGTGRDDFDRTTFFALRIPKKDIVIR